MTLHGKLQWIRGMVTDEKPYSVIDAALSEAVDLAKELEAERDALKRDAWIKRGLVAKLASMALHDDTGHPLDEGYTECWREIVDWLDEQERA